MFRKLLYCAALAGAVLVPSTAFTQSLCDLIPAAAMKDVLGISATLTAKPNMDGGNGCDYYGFAPNFVVVRADTGDDAGVVKTIFDQRMAAKTFEAVSLGDGGYFHSRPHQQSQLLPNQAFTQQALVFRAKGKIVSYLVATPGDGVPKAVMLSLGQLTLSKPIGTLKDSK